MYQIADNLHGRDYKFMEQARRFAIDVEPVRSSKICAMVVLKNNVISIGYNQYRSNPFQQRWGKNSNAIYFHAEVHAIYNALRHINERDLQKATIYIFRVKRPGANSKEWVDGLAKPCAGCMGAMAYYLPRRIIFSTETNGQYGIIQR